MGEAKSGLQLRTLLKKSGELELSLVDVPTPEPADDEVVVRVEASPINPSDLGLLIGPADMSTAQVSGTKASPVITAKMRRGEGFLLSWTDSAEVGHGRSSVWVHPGCDLHYKFDGGTPPKLDPTLLEEMNIESIQARGIELADATLAHSPHAR